MNSTRRSKPAGLSTPKGRRNKFDYDSKLEAFTLGGLLAEGLSFPFDFGFVPSTVAADGDPIDVMVLMDEPAHVGCVLDVRLIGVIEAEQTQDKKTIENDRLVEVAVHSYGHENIQSVSDVNKSILDQVEEFFISYNKSRGKKFKVLGLHGPTKAIKHLEKAMDAYKKESKDDARLRRQRIAIDGAIAALEGVDDDTPPELRRRPGRPKKTSSRRAMSAEGRERIAAAQRKRWAAAKKAQRSAQKAVKKR